MRNRIYGATLSMAAGSALAFCIGCVAGAPTTDPTPPTVEIRKWEMTPTGMQGAQTWIQPGGTATVPPNWLSQGGATNKADITVFAKDTEGVRHIEVVGSGKGRCSTLPNASGQFFTSSGPLTATFPKQSKTASPGTVETFMALHLDDLLRDASCGRHRFASMPSSQEFFLDSGTWTITAKAENCCGGQTSGTFTIIVQ